MIVYLSGKITGLDPEKTKTKFFAAEEMLREKGHKVINPMRLASPTEDWTWAMRKCIEAMMECNAIYLLPDWDQSKGATLEYEIANKLNFKLLNE